MRAGNLTGCGGKCEERKLVAQRASLFSTEDRKVAMSNLGMTIIEENVF
jgi:hypothetical protein